jgi:hypothetical protein
MGNLHAVSGSRAVLVGSRELRVPPARAVCPLQDWGVATSLRSENYAVGVRYECLARAETYGQNWRTTGKTGHPPVDAELATCCAKGRYMRA